MTKGATPKICRLYFRLTNRLSVELYFRLTNRLSVELYFRLTNRRSVELYFRLTNRLSVEPSMCLDQDLYHERKFFCLRNLIISGHGWTLIILAIYLDMVFFPRSVVCVVQYYLLWYARSHGLLHRNT